MSRVLVLSLSGIVLPLIVISPLRQALAESEAESRPQTVAAEGEFPRVPATEPDKAESTFRTLHGFRMELLAAEPLVTDPVALEYDENGLAWVVEMRDYPYTDKSTDRPNVERTTDAPLGRIRVLEDTDGDGRFDKSDIFAEDLSWPTGIALWKGGCYVTATPDVWYLKDTDGDRKADVRRKVFTGFKKLNVQGVINNPRWGLDHKLYCAGASNGGEITKPDDPGFKKVTFGKADFAFDPHAESFEVLTGGSRYGHSFDDWGNRFLCNIRNPVQHVLFENRYLARNPYLTVTDVVHDAAEAGDTLPVFRASPPEPWRAARALRYRTETGGMSLPRSELAGEGYFTSACGITIYRGSAYPKEFYGNAFLGEVAGNLIHRQVVEPDGPTFKSRRADEGAEIVASTDNWFRPVNFTNAPDGTLHVCDMYRETIEHPWSIPDDMKAVLDLESGRDRGRLYRLAPQNFSPSTKRPQLGQATAAELVAELENPNSWWRDTAHRLIYERQDKACVEPLRKMLLESTNPLARLHAMWSLEGLKALTDEDWIEVFFGQATPQLRTAALKLGEARLGSSKMSETWRQKFRAESPASALNPPVSPFQLALAAGSDNSPARSLLFFLLTDKQSDTFTISAALVSSANDASKLLTQFPNVAPGNTRPGFTYFTPAVARQLAMMVGARGDESEVRSVLSMLTGKNTEGTGTDSPDVRKFPPVLAGLAEGLRRSGKRLSQFATDDATQAALTNQFAEAAAAVELENRPLDERLGNVQLLAQGEWPDVRPTLERLINPRSPAPIQTEAVRAIAGFREAAVPELLLGNYRGLSPAIRVEIIEALASRTDRHAALLDAIEQKLIAAVEVPQARRLLIVRSKDPAIAGRAEKLFNASTGARREVVERYKAALKLAADPARGQVVFLRDCKACHKLRDQGFDVGPNLATVLHRTPDELLTHILDPNREVSPNYVEYVVELDDGRTVTGLIGDDTATGLTLRKAENVRETVLRRNIDAMYATGKSLMPEGFEQKLSPQDAADLVAFLLNRK